MQSTKHVEFRLNPVWEPVFQFFCLFFIVLKNRAYIFRLYHWFPGKWRLRNGRRNCILITRHYPDFGSASDWSCRVENFLQPIRSTTQIWVVTRHQYGISAFVSQWWRREMLAVFLGLFCCCFVSFAIFGKRPCLSYSKHFNIRRTWGRNHNKTGNLYSLCLVFDRFSRVTQFNVVFKKHIKPFLAFLPKLFP